MIAYHKTLSPEHLSASELDRMLAEGWYRMHQTIFTTTHLFVGDTFLRVYWLRFPLVNVREHRSHRKIRNCNRKFHSIIENFSGISQDHEELYTRYRTSIDFAGATSIQQCLFGEKGVENNIYNTRTIAVFDQDKLIAGAYFDLGSCAGTSILHFFDPAYQTKSLGKYLMLLTIDYLKAKGFTYYYPGYLVSGIPKMNYKLFIGSEAAQYYDQESRIWETLQEKILLPEKLTQHDQMGLMLAFME